jgi:hypothetical protein
MKIKFTFLIIFLTLCHLDAQDRQFWDQAVGSKAALLGGIVIGGIRDYSATYYNPGALGFLTKKSLSVNFNAYGIKDFQFIDGGGPGIDSRYTRVSLYPASLAGPLSFIGDSLNRFSYMIYCNGYSYVRVSERYEGYADVIPSRQVGTEDFFEGDELLVNQGKIDALLNEVSVGFGYSKKLSDNVSLGVSLIGAYRDQTKIRYESYAAFDTTNERTATTDVYIDIDYWAVRFAAKFGIAVEWEKLNLGATITTPSVAFEYASGGTDYASVTSNNVFIDTTTGYPIDILASDRQEGLPVSYKTPFSIAAGIEYIFSEATKIHFALEWFAPLSTYAVMQPESGEFIVNETINAEQINSAELLKVYDAMKSVFNVGIALEQKLTDQFTGYAAIRTDFSNADFDEIDGLFVGYTDWNNYHFTLGTSLEINETFIGIGFEYTHGERTDFPQIFNFPSGSAEPGDIVLFDQRGTCEAIYNNFNLFFGVTQLL